MDPHRLELEITETALMQALPELVARLGDISAMGVRLALDDFGTGYSSLGYLKRLPLHRVKIDRSFVNDLPDDKEDAAIVRATLSMAHALGLEVVAEGVELPEQRDFLRAAGCDQLQGWLVSRPMAAAAFEIWRQQRVGPDGVVLSVGPTVSGAATGPTAAGVA
jgi:diguanylate cyclase